MTDRLDRRHRVWFGLGGILLIALASACALAGFALTAVWPGLSWAVGAALGFVLLLPAARCLRTAITGQVLRVHDNPERSGTI